MAGCRPPRERRRLDQSGGPPRLRWPERRLEATTWRADLAGKVRLILGSRCELRGRVDSLLQNPLSVDELTTELSPVVADAVDDAVHRVEALLRQDSIVAGSDIARQDELLELLYWFEGEGFGGVASIDGIVRFTNLSEPLVRRTLDRLMARGDVLLDTSRTAEYRLTETGRREAARRFAAEFAPLLSQGHGECSDPECDCHTSEGGAAECHGRTHTHEPHGAH